MPLQDAPAFSAGGDAPLADRWWLAFDDPFLDARIEQALTNNYNLSAAWSRLNAAEALARRAQSDLYPEVDAVAGVERSESSTADDQTRIALGLAASYEIDLWGGIESRAQAERLRLEATQADYQTTAISLSSAVALTWYQLAEAQLQAQLVESQLEVNQTSLDLLVSRFAAGQIRSADVLRQRQLVEATREQLVIVRARQAVLEHQLAILEGRPPQAGAVLPGPALPDLPAAPAAGLPSTLLQRRPDIRSAFLRLQAADQEVAAAVSDQYPRLNLSASLQTIAERPQDLFEDWLFAIAGQAIAPLVDGGAREAEVDRTQAVRAQLLAEYGQTVLDAFGEVEDALAREASQAERIASLDQQLRFAEQTVDQLRTQYLNGVTDYLAVLTAVREQQQLQRDRLAARLDLLAFRISLYRALAGSFETPREREAAQANPDQNVEPEHGGD